MIVAEEVSLIARTIEPIWMHWPVKRAWLFGSALTKSSSERGDVDLIVEWDYRADPVVPTLKQLSLKHEIAEALGQDVDMLLSDRIDPVFERMIRSEKRIIFDRRSTY
jgi:predicted nucleotidyltransferase